MSAIIATLRLLWRQRRISYVASAPVAAFLVLQAPELLDEGRAAQPLGNPVLWLAIALTVVVAALAVVLFCAVLRPFRFIPVALAVSAPLAAIIAGSPLGDFAFAGALQIGAILLVVWLLFEPRADRFLPTVRFRAAGAFRTRAGPRAILNAVIPGLGPVEAYWGPLYDAARDPEHEDVRRVRYALGRGVFEEQTVHIGETGPEGGGYAFVNDATPGIREMTRGTYRAEIDAPGRRQRRRVTLVQERPNCPVRLAFLMWVEDRMGSEADAVAAKLRRGCDPSSAGREMRGRLGEA